MLSIDLYVCDVVLKDGGDIDLECVVVRRLCLSWMELDVGGVFGSSRARYGPLGTFLSRRRSTNRSVVVEKERSEWRMYRLERERVWLNIRKRTFPQAPSPTITSFLRISDIWN